MEKSQEYRDFIDAMVDACNNGAGQISSKNVLYGQGSTYDKKVLPGTWNRNADIKELRDKDDFLKEEYKINLFLRKLSNDQREIIAKILEEQYKAGVFETLEKLQEFEIEPFVGGYEGSPYEDFIGRVNKINPWKWPEK